MKKRKKGGWLVELVVLAVVWFAVEYIPAVSNAAMVIGAFAVIGWLVLKLFRGGSKGGSRARRGSAPIRMGRKAGSAFYNGAMDWLTPKEPTRYEQEIKARDEARKKYAWHEQQAKKYAGTSDEAWHRQRMKELYNKLR